MNRHLMPDAPANRARVGSGSTNRAVFLDRDGVINRMIYNPDFGLVDSPANPDEFALLPGVSEAIAEINRIGLPVVVVSNQPGVAKGKFSPALLDAMTDKMVAAVDAAGGKIDAIYYCLHHPAAVLPEYRVACHCRKPKPGLLLRAAQELEIDLKASYMIGDGITDVLAGRAAGMQTIFISSRKCYVCDELARHDVTPDYLAGDLGEAGEILRLLDADDSASAARYRLPCVVSRAYSLASRAL